MNVIEHPKVDASALMSCTGVRHCFPKPSAGEIVVLFAAGTDAEQYEQELRRAGLPTHR